MTVADPDKKMTMAEGRRLAGVSLAVMRSRRPELLEAGAVQLSATRWSITPRQMEAAGIIRIKAPRPQPEADPLEAAQAAREAARKEQAERDARAAQRAEVARESPTREESAGTPAAEGLTTNRAVNVQLAELERLRHAAELAEARHAAELADARREIAEAKAAARAWQDRAGTLELLANERGQMIAMLQAMLGGSAPVTRALDA